MTFNLFFSRPYLFVEMLSLGGRVRENTAGAKHGVGSSEGGGDAGEARAGAQAASQGGGDDVFDDKDHKDGNNDVFDDDVLSRVLMYILHY